MIIKAHQWSYRVNKLNCMAIYYSTLDHIDFEYLNKMYEIQFFLLLMLLNNHFRLANSRSVSLTVEGGVNLVGPYCPGNTTVRLLCEGVDLITLRWRINATDTGIVFFPDHHVGTTRTSSNTAILSAELTAVSQSLTDSRFGNFSSILTVNMSQLEQQNIVSISCGDPGIGETVPVDVHIVQETVPGDPKLIGVNVTHTLDDEPNSFVSINWEQQHVSHYRVDTKGYLHTQSRLLSVLS